MFENKIPAIILFIKIPSVGFVKTRLISDQLSKKQACELQIEMIKDSLLLLANITINFLPIISFYPVNKRREMEQLIQSFEPILPTSFLNKIVLIPQLGDSIGEHFASTFNQAFKLPIINSCIILGGDTPHLPSSVIYKAVEFLQKNVSSSIIGPSQMGGFYLFGLTEYIDNLDVIFQKENEFANLIEMCSKLLKFKTEILPFLFDIDFFQDVLSLYSLVDPVIKNEKNLDYQQCFTIPDHTINYLKKFVFKIP